MSRFSSMSSTRRVFMMQVATAATAVLPAEVGRNAAWPMSTAELAAMLESKGALLSR
jgi:hypothetical protein